MKKKSLKCVLLNTNTKSIHFHSWITDLFEV